MAWSTCPKCNCHNFEVVEKFLAGYKLAFIQCLSCGAVIGVMDQNNVGQRISELEKKIDCLQDHKMSGQEVGR